MFRSLAGVNYRIWASGAIVSNVGTWMQRTAQDWIVLTQLTHNSAAAVGFVMALQFAPALLLLPVTGWAADHLDRRKLLMITQGAMGTLGLGLGILTVTGVVPLRHARAAVSAMIVGIDRVAVRVEVLGEGPIASGMLADAVNDLHHGPRMLDGPHVVGDVDPVGVAEGRHALILAHGIH